MTPMASAQLAPGVPRRSISRAMKRSAASSKHRKLSMVIAAASVPAEGVR